MIPQHMTASHKYLYECSQYQIRFHSNRLIIAQGFKHCKVGPSSVAHCTKYAYKHIYSCLMKLPHSSELANSLLKGNQRKHWRSLAHLRATRRH